MSKLLFLLSLKAVVLLLLMNFLGIALSPDEAQYWTWSQDLDFGYYSKPPAIAWQIFLTTALFGHTELGVRFGAIIIGFLISFSVYRLALNSGLSSKGAFWSALLFACSPLGFYLSFAATTDGGAFLGITMAAALFARALFQRVLPNYFLIGLALFFGALYKWIALVFIPFLFLFFCLCPWLRGRSILYIPLITFMAFLPSLYWNFYHDFATFKHVFSTIITPETTAKSGNFFSFLGAQIALLSPVLFFFFLGGLWTFWSSFVLKKEGTSFKSVKVSKNWALSFCALFAIGFVIYLLLSLTKKIQPNWAAYFYPIGIVLVGWYFCEKRRKSLLGLRITLIAALVCSLGAFAIPFTQLPYKWNPFRQSLGWQRLYAHLLERGYDPSKDVLSSDTYQMTSLLSFYGPCKERAFFLNLQGNRHNQFSYWPPLSEKKEKTVYFVIAENIEEENPWFKNNYLQKLSSYCESVEYLGSSSLFESQKKCVKRAFFFRCSRYNGNLPLNSNKY